LSDIAGAHDRVGEAEIIAFTGRRGQSAPPAAPRRPRLAHRAAAPQRQTPAVTPAFVRSSRSL